MRHTRLHRPSSRQDDAQRAVSPSAPLTDVMSLQASIGNAAVGQLLGASAKASREQATPVDRRTQEAIDGASGGGQALSGSLQTDMQGVPGASEDVRIHQDTTADALTRQLGATAFTQGRDVFLRSDRDPSTPRGRETLAHELAHVAQGSVGAGAVMREPEQLDSGGGQKTSVIVAKITLENGDLEGSSTIKGHEGELEFHSISMGGPKNPGTNTGRKGGESGTDEIGGFRDLDKASPKIAEAVAKGIRITEARFVFLKQGDDGSYSEYLTLEFKDGYITSYQVSGGSESMTFSFKRDEK